MSSGSNIGHAPKNISSGLRRLPASDLTRVQLSTAGDRFEALIKDLESILQSTEWPQESILSAQDLQKTISTCHNLQALQTDRNEVPSDSQGLVEPLLVCLESVCTRLKKISKKYGMNRELTDIIRHPFASLSKDDCVKVLKTCRTDIENALSPLLNHLKTNTTLGVTLEERTPDASILSGGTQQSPASSITEEPSRSPPNKGTDGTTPSAPRIVSSQDEMPVSTQVQAPIIPDVPDSGDSRRSDLLHMAKTTFDIVETISGTLPVVGSYVGAAAKVGSTLVQMIQTMDSNEESARDLGAHTARLSELLSHFKKRSIEHGKEEFSSCINDLQSELLSVKTQVEKLNSSGTLQKLFFSEEKAEVLNGFQETLRTALEEMQLLVNINVMDLVTELYDNETRKEQRRLLDRLGDASYGARGNTIDDVVCLPGTRSALLERIDEWVRTTSPNDRMLWIKGMAGRGKSTVASTVAQRWKYRAACAIFHFRRDQSTLNERLVCALARQLGSSVVPEMKAAILKTIQENEDIAQGRLQEQFDTLLVGSLQRLEQIGTPILLVIDALDECGSTKYTEDFIKLIHHYSSSLPVNVKFLLTSRPEAPFLRVLEPRKWRTEDLDAVEGVDTDMAMLFRHGLSQIRDDHGLPDEWPSENDVGVLVQMSQGLFQWGRTAITYIGDGSPVHRLRELMESPSVWGGLDELYHQILAKAYEKVKSNPKRREVLVRVIAVLVVAPNPVTLEVLSFFHSDHGILSNTSQADTSQFLREDILADLNSLLLVPRRSTEPIRLVHTSVRDLLVDPERCSQRPYFIDVTPTHHNLAGECLRLMERDLKENICNLSDLSKSNSGVQDIVERKVSQGLQYCCRSWSTHLITGTQWSQQDSEVVRDLMTSLRSFSERKILFWLEVMSLSGATAGAVAIARDIYIWLKKSPGEKVDSSIIELWNDTYRLIAKFQEPISFGALHIYASALPFCPAQTKLWKYYHGLAMARVVHGPRDLVWPPNFWTQSVGSAARGVGFSPNGELLASGSDDGKIRLWNTETGVQLSEPLIGHGGIIDSVLFLADGKTIASATRDGSFQLWNAKSGTVISSPPGIGRGTLDGPTAFSPNGLTLAFGSPDCMLELWDVANGKLSGSHRTGDIRVNSVSSLAFSPDGMTLATGSLDGMIHTWDPKTGTVTGGPFIGHTEMVLSLVFSPNGRILASGSMDNTIWIWDVISRRASGITPLENDNSVSAIAFSQDGSVLASASKDSILLWDAREWKRRGKPLLGHNGPIFSFAWSPRDWILVSASLDGTVRSWNIEVDLMIDGRLPRPHASDNSASLHPGGEILESQSAHAANTSEGIPVTGAEFSDSIGDEETEIVLVAVSPDGRTIASGYNDGPIKLWDSKTGALLENPLVGHTGAVVCIAFSPDGRSLASGSYDQTVRSWIAETCAPSYGPMTGHTSAVQSVTYSPDGTIIASTSNDMSIRLWDSRSGMALGGPLTESSYSPARVAISPDNKVLVSMSWDTTLRSWQVGTGSPIGEPWTAGSSFGSFAFSPEGMLVVTSGSGTISVWDPLKLERCPNSNDVEYAGYKSCLASPIVLSFRQPWVKCFSDRLFWLPSDYHDNFYTDCVVLSHGTISFVASGVFAILDVSRALNL